MNIISYSYEVRQKVKENFEEKRKKAFSDAEMRKIEVYAKVEGIKSIDDALSKTGLMVYSEAINKTSKIPLEERIETLRLQNIELQQAKADLLVAAGFPKDYTKVKFECEKCQDTGAVGLYACDCLLKELRKQSYMTSGLGAMLYDQSFENFDTSLYPEKSRDMMKFILNSSKEFATNFSYESGNKNLLFCGGTGLGKTHLSTSIAKTLIDNGFHVVYDTAINIMNVFEKERFAKIGTAIISDKYYECDFLIIDDLGSEIPNAFSHATLYNILNTRINANKGMLISTNLSESKLKQTYDERIVSRLFGGFRTFVFSGEDIRLLKRKNNLGTRK